MNMVLLKVYGNRSNKLYLIFFIIWGMLIYCIVYNTEVGDKFYIYDDDGLYESMVQELNKLSDKDIKIINDWIKFKLEYGD